MATAQLHKQPEIAIGDIIARELESKKAGQNETDVKGNVIEKAISFCGINLPKSHPRPILFEGIATTSAIGNSGITGVVSYEGEKPIGKVFFLYQAHEESLNVWFYQSADYHHCVGKLHAKATAKLVGGTGTGTGEFICR